MGVVPALDELEHRHPRLDLGLEAVAREQLAFQGREEALAHRVVEAIADRSHRRTYPGFAAARAELDRGVLGALVGVMDDVAGTALPQRKIERLEHQLSAQMGLHRPAHDLAAEHIEHHRKIEEPGPGRNVSYVGHPQAIGLRRTKVALDQIRRRARVAITHGGVDPLASAGADQTGLFQQPRHPFAPYFNALCSEFGVDPWRTIGRVRALMNRAHVHAELRVRSAARRGRPLPPCIEAAGGDAQPPAHRRGSITGLIRTHELERRDGTAPVSVANQAAAFDKISRSSRRTRFWRLSRVSSWRSSVVSPALSRPSSRSACATQLRIDCEVVWNSRASSSALRPARTSSTIRCRYSRAYRLCVFPIVASPLPAQLPYCPRNRVNSTLELFIWGTDASTLGLVTPAAIVASILAGLEELFFDLFGGGSDAPPIPYQLKHGRHPVYTKLGLSDDLTPDQSGIMLASSTLGGDDDSFQTEEAK